MILKHKPFCISLEYTKINAPVQDEEIKQEISCLKTWQHRTCCPVMAVPDIKLILVSEMGPGLIENIRNKTSEIFGVQLPALQANTDEGKLLMSVANIKTIVLVMQKCELVYLVLAAAFISVFTDNPLGSENLAHIVPV